MKYTREQLSIILSKDDKKLINASAGTGKTTTLTTAVNREIRLDKERKTKLAVFTFTRAAAEEMKERLDVIPHFLGTIHSFSLREINKMEDQMLIVSEIMSEEKMKRLLLDSYISVYGLNKYYKDDLSSIYNYMTKKEITLDSEQVQKKYEKVIKHYTKRKKELGLYDYTDSPEYLVKKLQETGHKLDFTHFFVDEVQDIDYWEYELIARFSGKVFAIGDPRQNIYQFRNSTSHIFDKFLNIGYNLYVLKDNFRSYQEILDFAGADLVASRGCGGVIGGLELLTDTSEVILCRYNFQVKALSRYYENVYTIHAYKGLEADKIFLVDFPVKSEEEENIMFVAKTRAKDMIVTCEYEEILEKGRNIKYGL